MKTKIAYIIILVLFFSVELNSQNVVCNWYQYSQEKTEVVLTDMIPDTQDNIIICGTFKNETQGLETDKKVSNIFVSKFTHNGSLIWEKQITGKNYKYFSNICNDSEGNIYLSGYFSDTCRIENEFLVAKNYIDNFIIKYSKTGELLDIKQISGKFVSNKTFVVCDQQNNLYFAGSFCKKLKMNNFTADANYKSDIIVVKYNNKGEFVNTVCLQGDGNDVLNDIKIDNTDNIVITGSFEQNLNIENKTINSKGRTDVFLIQFDNNLNTKNIIQSGSYYEDYGQAITIDNKNNIYLSGCFSGDIKFENNLLTSNGVLDVFVCKYNNETKLKWCDSFGGKANDYVKSVTLNMQNNLYVSGNFRGEITKNIDDQLNTNTIKSYNFTSDYFIAKYNNIGEFLYIDKIGGAKQDVLTETFTDIDNFIYMSGNFQENCIFTNDSIKTTNKNHFMLSQLYDCDFAPKLKLQNDTVVHEKKYTIEPPLDFETYLWSNNSTYAKLTVDSSATYKLTVVDTMGCISSDSITVELNDFCNEINFDDENNKNIFKVTVFPIPATSYVDVNIDNINTTEELFVEIYSITGQYVSKHLLNSHKKQTTKNINLSNISNGNYIMKIINGNNIVSKEFIKIKED